MRPYHLHGDTGTRLYRIWKAMKCRCLNHNHHSYEWYGKRGIRITSEWIDDYPNFKKWALDHGYDEDLELDRIDVNGDYSPENCRWITHHEQTLNRRSTLYVECESEVLPWKEFLAKFHINKNTARDWRYHGILENKVYERHGLKIKILGGKESLRHATPS